MLFQGKLLNQTWQNSKKPSFRHDFGWFWPKFGPQNFFCELFLYEMLEIIASYHCMPFQEKLLNQTWQNGRKPSCRPDFGLFWPKFGPQKNFLWVLPILDVRNCCKLSLYAIKTKTNEPNLRKWQKT